MFQMAKASLHVKRHLSPRERNSIALGLALLANTRGSDHIDELRAAYTTDAGIDDDDALRALATEIITARKVKVCRSKTSAE